VLAVIIFHVNRNWLPGGFIGVDIFLVISGFLITSILLKQEGKGSPAFLPFYAGRIRRIVPAYVVLLAIVTLCAAVLLTPSDFGTYRRSLRAALYSNSNNFFASQSDYFAPAAHELPLLHTWSLAVEMQFYLLLPAIVRFIPRRFIWPVLLAATGLILAYSTFRVAHGQRHFEYFSLVARIPEFLVGSLLAIRQIGHGWTRGVSNLAAGTGILFVIAGCWFISEEVPFPGFLTLVPCVGAALLIAARGSDVNRWLSNAALVWIGALSYSLYLWHWPVLAGLRYFLETYSLPTSALLTFATLTLACSYASYRYVELPFRDRRSGAGLLRPAALAAGVVAAIWAAISIHPRLSSPLSEPLTRYAEPSEICHGSIVGDCLRGDRLADRTLVLLGDSHGAQLNLFADVVGRESHTRIRVITASSCVPIEGFDVERPVEWARAPCLAQIEKAKSYIESSDGLVIAGMWQYHFTSHRFLEALDSFIGAAAKRNQRVIVLAQVPMLASNVLRKRRFEELGLPRSAVALNAEWELANSTIQRLVQRHTNATFLDLSRNPLFATLPFENGVLIYYDSHHLNEVGSRRYGEVASPYFSEWAATLAKGNRERQ
jgi:peptidoglycan/LPS O-acetylase OafA/YrhL